MTENSAEKQRGRPFTKGKSGNPAGKPKGARNHATRAVLDMLDGEADALTRKAIELALQGDTTALRLCLERLAPPAKDKPVRLRLPEIQNIEDTAKALAGVIQSMADGHITPSEASAITAVLELYRKHIETVEIEARLQALEEKHGGK